MRALATTEEHVRFWRSHARQGIVLCLVLPVIVVVDVLLSPDRAHPVALCAVAAGTAVLALAVPLVPLEAVVRHRRGRLFFDAWDGAGIVLIGVLAALDGGVASPYTVFLYVLLAHAAMAYPPVGTATAGGAAIACYLVVGAVTATAGTPGLVTGCLTLAVATGTCTFASHNLVRAHGRTTALAERLAELADRDGLTGLLNHRAVHRRLDAEVALAGPDRPLSLVLVDVDEFKAVNDTHGHPAGDAVLRLVADVLRAEAGEHGHAARPGGDELALLLPATGGEEALDLADRVCRRVRESGTAFGVSVSAGVASVTGGTTAALVAEADAAVYHAKRTGRDRAASAPSPPDRDRRRPAPARPERREPPSGPMADLAR